MTHINQLHELHVAVPQDQSAQVGVTGSVESDSLTQAAPELLLKQLGAAEAETVGAQLRYGL